MTASAGPFHGRTRWPRRVLVIDSPSGPTHLDPAAMVARGIDVLRYPDGARGLIGAATDTPAAVIAPTDMTGVDVLRFVEALSGWGNIPVIVGLTSCSDSERLGFDALARGARALIALPFGGDRLLAGLHGLGSTAQQPDAPLTLGSITLDAAAHRITVEGTHVHLTPKEFVLLERLMSEHPRVLRVDELAESFGEANAATIAAIRVLVARLRRKLDAASTTGSDTALETVRGLGYRMAE